MKHPRIRHLLALGALLAAALVFAGVATTPVGHPAALQVWRAGRLTEVAAGVRADGRRSPLSHLKASNADATDAFGSALAISRDGGTLVVGADLEAGDAGGVDGAQDRNPLPGAGAVYVYQRTADGWTQQAYLKAPQPETGAGFGLSVALSDDGDTVAVGAPFETHAQGEGAVHLFRRAHGRWTPQGRLLPVAGGEARLFGVRVALSGQGAALAVGAHEGTPHGAHGAVHVFTQGDDRWTPVARLEAAVPRAGDGFGHSLALDADGRTLAVGARPTGMPRGAQLAPAGLVRVFAGTPTGWVAVADLPGEGAAPGQAVSTEVALSADGARLVVGRHGVAGGAGEVRVFDRQQGRWRQSATLQGLGVGGGFGERLSLSAMHEPALFKAATADARPTALVDAGAVYLFDQRAGQWAQTLRLNAARSGGHDLFGSALAVSGDGRWLATGARLDDSGARGIDAPSAGEPAANSGAVYVFAPA